MNILTYSSFANSKFFSKLKENLEKQNIHIHILVNGYDSNSLANALLVGIPRNNVDIVMGLTNYDLYKCHSYLVPLQLQLKYAKIYNKQMQVLNRVGYGQNYDDYGLPYDYAFVAYNLNQDYLQQTKPDWKKHYPDTIDQFLLAYWKQSVLTLNPQTSQLGNIFHHYVLHELARMSLDNIELQDNLNKFNQSIIKVLPNWDMEYGLYEQGYVPIALSFSTSPFATPGMHDQAIAFKTGNPLYLEYAGIVNSSKNKKIDIKVLKALYEPKIALYFLKDNCMIPFDLSGLSPYLHDQLIKSQSQFFAAQFNY